MKNHTLVTNNLKYISDSVYEKIKNYTIGKDDLYLTIAGTIGSVGIVPEMFDGMNLTENAVKLTNILIDKMFLVYGISSQFVQSQFSEKTKQMAQPKLAIERILTTLIPLPPINEQISIVSRIKEIMPIADKYEKSQEALDKLNANIFDKLKKSVLQEAIQGKLVPQNPNDEPASVLLERIKEEKTKLFKEGKLKKKDLVDSVIYKGDDNKYYEQIGKEVVDISEDIPFEIPESWIWARLGDIAAISAGGTPDRTNNRYWNNGDIPWLKISDVTSSTKYVTRATEFITQEGLENSSAKIYKKGTILYTIFATVGEVAILDFDSTCNQAIAGIDLYDKELSSWVYYFLANLKDYIISISKGCAQLNINQKILKSVLIPIPPKKEQTRIISCLDEIISSIMSR